MISSRLPRAVAIAATVLALGAGLASEPAQAAERKEPPVCAAINFRPIVSGMPDGPQDAGLYKSRFGRIVIKALVEAGAAKDYFMEINGKRPEPLAGGVPKTAEGCLRAKNVSVPVKTVGGACMGERFRVAIDRSGKGKVAMLFALQGNQWLFCNAAAV